MKKILLVHLAANGDCLMATTLARQIKHDYANSHLTWAISYKYKHILDNNPYIDCIWEVQHDTNTSPFSEVWYRVKNTANEQKAKGKYDLIFFSQIYPEHVHYYDGTTRSSTFNGYPHKITVPVEPVIYLRDSEINRVTQFVKENFLSAYNKVVLFECTASSGQSFMNPDLAIELSDYLLTKQEDLLIIISCHLKLNLPHKRMIDGSLLTFRENAELSKYCTHIIGCSSGISWLLTSSWAKQLPMLQILNKNALGFGFASVKYDFKYWQLSTDHIIETTEIDKNKLKKITCSFINDFSNAKTLHDQNISPSVLSFKYTITIKELKGNILKLIKIIRQYSHRNNLKFKNKIFIIYLATLPILPYYFNFTFLFAKQQLRNILKKLFYGQKILNAIKWRIDFVHQRYLKLSWQAKQFLNFSKKEKINNISVIVVGRNDNYGGDFSLRLQTTLDWNLSHLPNPELIYVEWNQIKERPSDCEWIVKRYPNAKCYIVPNVIHRKIAADPEKMPVMEYFAKNFGIRRSATDWILLINADCFIGHDVIKHLNKSNTDIVYGTHYVNIKWDKKPIAEYHSRDKKLISLAFSADKTMGAVVGNLILTHKKNWMKATGYDERLTATRVSVDTNGLSQLLYLGLKPMVIGHHFHLDHPESMINSGNLTHGDDSMIDKNQNIPYTNSDNWGLLNYPLKQISERIWELQPI